MFNKCLIKFSKYIAICSIFFRIPDLCLINYNINSELFEQLGDDCHTEATELLDTQLTVNEMIPNVLEHRPYIVVGKQDFISSRVTLSIGGSSLKRSGVNIGM